MTYAQEVPIKMSKCSLSHHTWVLRTHHSLMSSISLSARYRKRQLYHYTGLTCSSIPETKLS
jgi:hypothetical protein